MNFSNVETSHFQLPPSITSTIFTSTRFPSIRCTAAFLTHSRSFIFMRFSVCFPATCLHSAYRTSHGGICTQFGGTPFVLFSTNCLSMPIKTVCLTNNSLERHHFAQAAAVVNVKETAFPSQYKSNAWGSNSALKPLRHVLLTFHPSSDAVNPHWSVKTSKHLSQSKWMTEIDSYGLFVGHYHLLHWLQVDVHTLYK